MLPHPDTDGPSLDGTPAEGFPVPAEVWHTAYGMVAIAFVVVAIMGLLKQAVMQVQPQWLDHPIGQWVLRLLPAVIGGLIAGLTPLVLPEAPPLLPWEGATAVAIGVGAGAWSRDIYRIAKGVAADRWPAAWGALLPSELRDSERIK